MIPKAQISCAGFGRGVDVFCGIKSSGAAYGSEPGWNVGLGYTSGFSEEDGRGLELRWRGPLR